MEISGRILAIGKLPVPGLGIKAEICRIGMRKHHIWSSSSIILPVILLVMAIAGKSYSQSPDKEATISYLNKLGGDSISFGLKGAVLTIRMNNNEQKTIREDKVNLVDLDTVSAFEAESKLTFMNCMPGFNDCVTRVLTVQKIKKTYSRISIPSSAEQHHGYAAALAHLVKIFAVKNYKDAVEFPGL
jgi:hypothetical protein